MYKDQFESGLRIFDYVAMDVHIRMANAYVRTCIVIYNVIAYSYFYQGWIQGVIGVSRPHIRESQN